MDKGDEAQAMTRGQGGIRMERTLSIARWRYLPVTPVSLEDRTSETSHWKANSVVSLIMHSNLCTIRFEISDRAI